MLSNTQTKAATTAKRPISPSPDPLPSNKKHAADPELTIEKELDQILDLFKQREKKKEELFNEWVKNGLNPPPFICFTYHPDFLVESADSFLPPVADPAEWWAFCDSRHGLVKTRQFRDEWKAYQYRGDKLAAFAFTRVTNKYSLPVGWVTTLGEIFTSNQYWAKFERVFELNVYCDGVYNRTPNQSYLDGNVLEVSILFLL